jgi:hypothetical protein
MRRLLTFSILSLGIAMNTLANETLYPLGQRVTFVDHSTHEACQGKVVSEGDPIQVFLTPGPGCQAAGVAVYDPRRMSMYPEAEPRPLLKRMLGWPEKALGGVIYGVFFAGCYAVYAVGSIVGALFR